VNTATSIDVDGLLRRLHLPTIRRLYGELAVRAETEEMSHRDFLAILLAEEVAHRGQTRIQRSVRAAGFPFLATIEDFDFTFQTSVRLQLLGSFLGPELFSEGRSLILCGPTGLGKTHLAVAIAYRAIQNGATALFREANALVHELSEASRVGRLAAAMEPYLHVGVLVVDEIGYLAAPADAANVLFQVVNQRYLKKRPMVFTTNKPLAAWAEVLHDADLAEAIIDRILAHGRFLELRGSSYRTRHLKRPTSPPSKPPSRPDRVGGNDRPQFPEPTHRSEAARRIRARRSLRFAG
jgi:DNA replication protein DnaC